VLVLLPGAVPLTQLAPADQVVFPALLFQDCSVACAEARARMAKKRMKDEG